MFCFADLFLGEAPVQIAAFLSIDGLDGVWPADAAVALLDTSSYDGVLGWTFRNVLALLAARFSGQVVAVAALRAAQGRVTAAHSQVMHIRLPEVPAGWPECSGAGGITPGWEGAAAGQV
jgi:Ubiquitin-like modifier-activating enzyme ATG7 N-terminus